MRKMLKWSKFLMFSRWTYSGSGKTYTMKPLPLKASRDILRLMNHTYRNQGFYLFVSFFEIYGGKLYDLLNERKYVALALFSLNNFLGLF